MYNWDAKDIIPNSFIYLHFIPQSSGGGGGGFTICYSCLRNELKTKQKERKLWKHDNADVMSEEEEHEDAFIRHRQSWRS